MNLAIHNITQTQIEAPLKEMANLKPLSAMQCSKNTNAILSAHKISIAKNY
jgi:hypothetical protein